MKWIIRILAMMIGNGCIGIAVALFRFANLGADSFTTFTLGIVEWTGWTYAITALSINLILFLLLIARGRDLIGIGTLVNMVGIGFTSDFFLAFLENAIGTSPDWVSKLIVLLIGQVILGFGISLYITANLGVAPYDAIGIIVERMTNGRIKFATARIIQDVTAVGIGILLNAAIGIGTVITALLTGPMVQFFNRHVSSQLLNEPIKK